MFKRIPSDLDEEQVPQNGNFGGLILLPKSLFLR